MLDKQLLGIFMVSSAGLFQWRVILWLVLGIHNVPYIGKSNYTDLTKKGIKETNIQPYQSNTDRVMASKLCR